MSNTSKELPPLAIRFLRPGFVPVYKKPEGFHEMTEEQKIAWASEILEKMTDQEIIEAMADFENPQTNGYFDEIDVEAIQAPSQFDSPHENIYASVLWKTFSDPEYSVHILKQLKQLGEFVRALGFNQIQFSQILTEYQKDTTPHKTLKLLDNAKNAALQTLRDEHGEMLFEKIKNDPAAPQLLIDLIDQNSIHTIGFERIGTSLDFMPDHCVYITLFSGDVLIGIRTNDRTESFDNCDYEYGDYDIRDAESFSDIVNTCNLIDGDLTVQEANEILKYLEDIKSGIDAETFNYILERED